MRKGTTGSGPGQVSLIGPDDLTEAIRQEIGTVIERLVDQELSARLGAGRYARVEGRSGYRNGSEPRTIQTSMGSVTFRKSRARVWKVDGSQEEFQSDLLTRYKRRAQRVDDEILAMYLGGVSTRRIKRIVRLLGLNQTMSPSSVSQVVATLREHFETWQQRSLKQEEIAYLYLDAIAVKVRLAGRVGSRPILAAVGVRETGEKVLLGLWSKGSESTESWKDALESMKARGLPRPLLVIIDGCGGLRSALDLVWSGIEVQRCVVHKLRNLLRHAPKHAYDEVRDDFHAIVYAESRAKADVAYDRFVTKWIKLCESVARSLQEGGEELLTFFNYPKSQWKALRTTNVIERLNGEFRRRVKTQGSLPNECAVLILLYGLVASGLVQLRKIDGFRAIRKVIKEKHQAA